MSDQKWDEVSLTQPSMLMISQSLRCYLNNDNLHGWDKEFVQGHKHVKSRTFSDSWNVIA